MAFAPQPPPPPPPPPPPSEVAAAVADVVETVVNETTQAGEQAQETAEDVNEDVQTVFMQMGEVVDTVIRVGRGAVEIGVAAGAYVFAKWIAEMNIAVGELKNSLAKLDTAIVDLLSDIKHLRDRESAQKESAEQGRVTEEVRKRLEVAVKALEEIRRAVRLSRVGRRERWLALTRLVQSVGAFGTTLVALRSSTGAGKGNMESDFRSLDRMHRALERLRFERFRRVPDARACISIDRVRRALSETTAGLRASPLTLPPVVKPLPRSRP